ncbi:hypothetical protein LJC48_07785 [Desulfovibrio sp. OttesenSCG-928-C06]|nr:hypothetical protein [Desulfovibrio sp. OttesenSCG-928-C06]
MPTTPDLKSPAQFWAAFRTIHAEAENDALGTAGIAGAEAPVRAQLLRIVSEQMESGLFPDADYLTLLYTLGEFDFLLKLFGQYGGSRGDMLPIMAASVYLAGASHSAEYRYGLSIQGIPLSAMYIPGAS